MICTWIVYMAALIFSEVRVELAAVLHLPTTSTSAVVVVVAAVVVPYRFLPWLLILPMD